MIRHMMLETRNYDTHFRLTSSRLTSEAEVQEAVQLSKDFKRWIKPFQIHYKEAPDVWFSGNVYATHHVIIYCLSLGHLLGIAMWLRERGIPILQKQDVWEQRWHLETVEVQLF